jgi:membrane protein implicated in regulation of membrane protease activity
LELIHAIDVSHVVQSRLLNWFILAVLLFILETAAQVHFLWFGLAAVVVGVLPWQRASPGRGS